MPAKVADASVVAAVAFEEPRAAEAEALLAEADLHAPELLPYELASVAWKKARGSPERREGLEAALADVLSTAIRLVSVDHVAVFRLASSTGLTVYDASYLWLARALGVPLVTFDARLRRLAKPLQRARRSP